MPTLHRTLLAGPHMPRNKATAARGAVFTHRALVSGAQALAVDQRGRRKCVRRMDDVRSMRSPQGCAKSPATPGSPHPIGEQDMKRLIRHIRYHYAMWRHQRTFGKFPPMGF